MKRLITVLLFLITSILFADIIFEEQYSLTKNASNEIVSISLIDFNSDGDDEIFCVLKENFSNINTVIYSNTNEILHTVSLNSSNTLTALNAHFTEYENNYGVIFASALTNANSDSLFLNLRKLTLESDELWNESFLLNVNSDENEYTLGKVNYIQQHNYNEQNIILVGLTINRYSNSIESEICETSYLYVIDQETFEIINIVENAGDELYKTNNEQFIGTFGQNETIVDGLSYGRTRRYVLKQVNLNDNNSTELLNVFGGGYEGEDPIILPSGFHHISNNKPQNNFDGYIFYYYYDGVKYLRSVSESFASISNIEFSSPFSSTQLIASSYLSYNNIENCYLSFSQNQLYILQKYNCSILNILTQDSAFIPNAIIIDSNNTMNFFVDNSNTISNYQISELQLVETPDFESHELSTISSSHICPLDVDNDSDIDFIIDQNLYINDDLSFNPIALLSYEYGRLVSTDLDSDNMIDFVTINPYWEASTTIKFYRNIGDTSFDLQEINTSNFISDIVTADIDNDNDMDIIACNYNSISILKNDGSQNFTESIIQYNEDGLKKIILADLDNNNFTDIIVANHEGSPNLDYKISLFSNTDGNNFERIDMLSNVGSIEFISSLDINADGFDDIVFSSFCDYSDYPEHDRIGCLVNQANLSFSEVVLSESSNSSIAVGDYNQDNFDDLVIGESIWINQGNLNFSQDFFSYLTNGSTLISLDFDFDGDMDIVNSEYLFENLSTVNNSNLVIEPSKFNLTNYPNPFNPQTTIQFTIDQLSSVELVIYNIKGQIINTLIDSNLNKGKHSVTWTGINNKNEKVSSGVYFYQLFVNNSEVISKKCVLLKKLLVTSTSLRLQGMCETLSKTPLRSRFA